MTECMMRERVTTERRGRGAKYSATQTYLYDVYYNQNHGCHTSP